MNNFAESLRAQAAEQARAWDVPSLSICVVQDGKTLLCDGIGMRDNASRPADAQTLYQIASCTKAFTATAAAVLATEGKLDFDTPVIEYLPAFRLNDRYATENLTLRDFLSHRSGLPRHEYAWYGTGFSREQLLKNLKDLPLSAPIRYRFQYSNFNYLIAGAVIEAVSGEKFEDFLKEKLLRPLGMERSETYLEAMRTVIDACEVPVATGERFINPMEFDSLMTTTAVRYIRPDMCVAGGLTAGRKIAAEAEQRGVYIIPHNPLGPVSTAACLQLDAVIPNFEIQEYPMANGVCRLDKEMKEPFQVENGYIKVPDGPGLGIELIDDIDKAFPFQGAYGGINLHEDGSVVDR